VGFPREMRENNVHEDLRDAPLWGVVVDLMFGWLFDISWPMILLIRSHLLENIE
jgi:hypothetical protein